MRPRSLVPVLVLLCFAVSLMMAGTPFAHAQEVVDNSRSGNLRRPLRDAFDFGAHLDLGYARSSTQPANRLWRSKSTTYELDRVKFNNLAIAMGKEGSLESRWGFQLGLQAGVDVASGIPDEADAIGGADYLGHLYYSHLSYLFDLGQGLLLKGGLLPGFPGYPNFSAFDNVNYTRPYLTDYVPYFLWGLKAELPFSSRTMGALYVVSGWDYLEKTNSIPSYGFQFKWSVASSTTLVQNFYYGSDQEATAREYWRFATNTNLEWSGDRFLVAGSLTYGNQKNAAKLGGPREEWLGAALWCQWKASSHWDFGLRPELFEDLDGMQTGYRQTIRAITVSAGHDLRLRENHETRLRAEYRFDRSTGADGGFYEGENNALVPEQSLFMLSLLWRFNTR